MHVQNEMGVKSLTDFIRACIFNPFKPEVVIFTHYKRRIAGHRNSWLVVDEDDLKRVKN